MGRERLSNNNTTELLMVHQSDISLERQRDVERHTQKKINDENKKERKKVNLYMCVDVNTDDGTFF